MPVSNETKDFLEDAKKGKPRKFVLLVKGTTIVSLVVFKKGVTTKFIKEAKEQGTGIPYHGIITGKGMDLSFQLAVEDGFDKAPIKDLILKKYLEEEAGFKCKPLFEVVASRGLALDPDDPLHARFMNLQTRALEASDANPVEAKRIGALCQEIGKLLDEDQRDPATAKLVELEKILEQQAPSGTAGDPVDPQQQAFETLRQKLEPLLLAAKKADPEKATALANVWNYADAQAEAKKYAGAVKALQGLADAVKKTLAAPAKTDAQKFGIEEGLVAERRAQLEKYFSAQAAAARVASIQSVGLVRDAIEAQVPEEEEESEELGDLIDDAVGNLYDEACDELIDAVNSQMPDRLLKTVEDWRKRVAGDALISHLRTSQAALGVKTSVDADFERLFTSFENKIRELATAQ